MFGVDGYVITGGDLTLLGRASVQVDTGTATLDTKLNVATQLEKTGLGTLVLNGGNSYAGGTLVSTGTLQAGAVNVFSPNSALSVVGGGTLDLNGFDQTVKGLSNAGSVYFGPAVAEGAAFTPVTLTVNGNYVGQGGTLNLRTQLGDDDSPTDQMRVSGDVSGSTTLKVANANGLGALTSNGIMLVQVGGSSSANAFTLAGDYVDAGAFRYRLFEGAAGGADENWYLRSQSTTPPPPPPCGDCEAPPPPPPPPCDNCEEPLPPPSAPEYRPEVPWVTALPSVLRQGDLALLGTAHQRRGDELRDDNQGRLWGRFLSSDTQGQLDNVTSPEVRSSNRGIQFGLDLFEAQGAGGARHDAGVYGGWLKAKADISGMTGGTLNPAWVGAFSPETTALGAYWSYRTPARFYLDAALQQSWYGGKGAAVTGVDTQISGRGTLASLEMGYGFSVTGHWLLEPQMQLVQQSTDLDAMAIPNATVEYGSHSSRIGRLGFRLLGDYALDSDKAIKPYLRANLWQGFGGEQRVSFVNEAAVTPILTQANYRSGELGVGFSLSLGSGISLHAELDRMVAIGGGTSAARGTSGSIGLRFDW